jgi:ATP-grasp domain
MPISLPAHRNATNANADTAAVPVASASPRPHQGMPPLDEDGPPLSFFEFWPMWAFYPPVMLYAAWLMLRYRGALLPTAANPSFPGGGFFGESKADILALAMKHVPEWVAPFVRVERPEAAWPGLDVETDAALALLADAGLGLPVVAKPDLGCRGAGVKLVRSRADLQAYLQAFPRGATLVLQQLVPFEGEAGIFYCRRPGERQGRIISVTLKYFPHVTGDGQRTLRELILADPRAGQLSHLYLKRHTARLDEVIAAGQSVRLAFAGSHSRGAIFRNGTHLVTPAMEACFDDIAQRLPEFHFGRFDVRFEDFADLQSGHGFTIVEVNGAGAESTHIWDRRTGLLQAWRDLMRQYRWLFEIGHANRARGFRPMRLTDFLRDYRREKHLTPLYPATD